MLEFFRKYSAIAFIILIILFIGLVFMVDGVGRSGIGSGPKMMSLNGRGYTYTEVERQGSDYYNMLFGLRSSGYTGEADLMTPYMTHVAQYNPQTGGATDETEYLANRLILQDLAEQYGVVASQEQIEKEIQESLFVTEAGKFDQAGYAKFIERRVKKYGLGVQDLNTLVGEIISMKKLQSIVGAGFAIDESLVRRSALVTGQTLSFEQFSIPIDQLKSTITVSDEEVEAYWNENTGNYLTDPQVKVQYVITNAGIEAAEKAYAAEVVQKAKAEGKTQEEIDALDTALPADKKTQLTNAAIIKADTFFTTIQDEEGRGFEKTAKELGLEVKTSDLFTAATAPAEFQVPTQAGMPAQMAFYLSGEVDTMDAMSDIYPIGSGRNLIFRVIERVDAVPLEFVTAKDAAKVDLIQSKLDESMETITAGLREELVAAAKEGKLVETAKEKGMTYAKYEDAKIRDEIDGERYFFRAFQAAAKVADNELSEAVVQDIEQLNISRVIFVRPLKRAFIETEESKEMVESQITGSKDGLNYITFSNWFEAQRANAQFERLSQ